jgi:hypothetical protein
MSKTEQTKDFRSEILILGYRSDLEVCDGKDHDFACG